MQSCSKWEGGLEPENMGETGLFLNTLLELRINTSHHRLLCWLMVNCAAKLSHCPQLLARHCHVSHSWRAVSHLAPAWSRPQDTMFSFTALRASPCSGFLASCLAVPKRSKVWEGDRESCRVFLSACVANGQTYKLHPLA